MASSSSTVTTALQSILREDLNVDMARATPEARLIDDVGWTRWALPSAWSPSKSGSASRCPRKSS